MTIEVISEFSAITSPLPDAGGTDIPLLTAPVVPVTDASGATLVAPNGGGDGALVHIAADGTETTSVIDVADGYSIDPQSGVPLGTEPGTFVFTIHRPFLDASGEQMGDEVDLLLARVDAAGSVVETNAITEAFGGADFNGFGDLSLTPMSDGRIFYTHEGLNTNGFAEFGVIDQGASGQMDVVPLSGGGSHTNGHAMALADGGTLLFVQLPGANPEEIYIEQYDAEGDQIATTSISSSTFAGIDAFVQDLTLAVDLDENGDLNLYAADTTVEPAQTYVQVFDLLPVTDTPIDTEPEVPDLDDELTGTEDADDLRGAAGDDYIDGNGGDDFLRGNHDNDEMYGGDGADNMNGGFGDDYVSGGAGDDKVSGYDGNDSLFGGDGADAMHGGRGDDAIYGGAGDDIMRGADGDDTLSGDAGNDLLIGGKGADVYAFDMFVQQNAETVDLDGEGPGGEVLFLDDPVAQDNGTDTIKGFSVGEDKIALDGSYDVVDDQDPLATNTVSDLTFDDIFLSQDESAAVIQAGETTIRLENVDVNDLSESDFILV